MSRINRTLALLVALTLVPSGAAHAQAGGTPPADGPQPLMGDGVILTPVFVSAILDQVKARLDQRGMYSGWVDDLAEDPPTIRFEDDIGDNQALYQPTGQGPLGREGNTVYLKPGPNPLHLEDDELATITHELWHAWFDFVPTYPFTEVARFSDAQDEAIGGFIDKRVEGAGLTEAVGQAVSEAMGEGRGGTSKDAVDALIALNTLWDGTLLNTPFQDAQDAAQWEIRRRGDPEIRRLEALMPAENRQMIADRVAELERRRAEDAALEDGAIEDAASPAEPEPVGLAPVRPTDLNALLNALPAAVAGAPGDGTTQVMFIQIRGMPPGQAPRAGPGGGSAPPLPTLLIRSLGQSTGEAFEVLADGDMDALANAAASGLAIEPVQLDPVTATRLASSLPGTPLVALGYCLEFAKLPPVAGQLFRVAPAAVQQRFAARRAILAAGDRLADHGGLHPDSEPMGYTHSIKQWALWTAEEGFDRGGFERAFLEYTRKNVEASGGEWSDAFDSAVRNAIPNRWSDVQAVLREAGT